MDTPMAWPLSITFSSTASLLCRKPLEPFAIEPDGPRSSAATQPMSCVTCSPLDVWMSITLWTPTRRTMAAAAFAANKGPKPTGAVIREGCKEDFTLIAHTGSILVEHLTLVQRQHSTAFAGDFAEQLDVDS